MARTTYALVGLAAATSIYAAGALAGDSRPIQVAMAATSQQLQAPHARLAFVAPEQFVPPFSGITNAGNKDFVLPGFTQMLSDPAEDTLKAQRAASRRYLMNTYIDARDPRLQGWVNLLAAAD